MSNLERINDLAFNMMNEEMESVEQFDYAKQIYDLSAKQTLNNNQQAVLDILKDKSLSSSPFFTLWFTMENDKVFNEQGMSVEEQFQVLQAFVEWGLSNER